MNKTRGQQKIGKTDLPSNGVYPSDNSSIVKSDDAYMNIYYIPNDDDDDSNKSLVGSLVIILDNNNKHDDDINNNPWVFTGGRAPITCVENPGYRPNETYYAIVELIYNHPTLHEELATFIGNQCDPGVTMQFQVLPHKSRETGEEMLIVNILNLPELNSRLVKDRISHITLHGIAERALEINASRNFPGAAHIQEEGMYKRMIG